jgi:toxin ParE1/3/4
MSAHKPTIRLTTQAERDIENILLYSERNWGFDQRETYAVAITQALDLLRDHPKLGRQHEGLFPGCRSVRVEQHVLYYHQPRSNLIEIVRVLHGRQDPTGNVGSPDI